MTKIRQYTILGLFLISILPSQSYGADKITLSSTNPTAFEIDHVVAKEKGFFAKENLDVRVEVDGGIDPDTAPRAIAAGADVLVAGTASAFIE